MRGNESFSDSVDIRQGQEPQIEIVDPSEEAVARESSLLDRVNSLLERAAISGRRRKTLLLLAANVFLNICATSASRVEAAPRIVLKKQGTSESVSSKPPEIQFEDLKPCEPNEEEVDFYKHQAALFQQEIATLKACGLHFNLRKGIISNKHYDKLLLGSFMTGIDLQQDNFQSAFAQVAVFAEAEEKLHPKMIANLPLESWIVFSGQTDGGYYFGLANLLDEENPIKSKFGSNSPDRSLDREDFVRSRFLQIIDGNFQHDQQTINKIEPARERPKPSITISKYTETGKDDSGLSGVLNSTKDKGISLLVQPDQGAIDLPEGIHFTLNEKTIDVLNQEHGRLKIEGRISEIDFICSVPVNQIKGSDTHRYIDKYGNSIASIPLGGDGNNIKLSVIINVPTDFSEEGGGEDSAFLSVDLSPLGLPELKKIAQVKKIKPFGYSGNYQLYSAMPGSEAAAYQDKLEIVAKGVSEIERFFGIKNNTFPKIILAETETENALFRAADPRATRYYSGLLRKLGDPNYIGRHETTHAFFNLIRNKPSSEKGEADLGAFYGLGPTGTGYDATLRAANEIQALGVDFGGHTEDGYLELEASFMNFAALPVERKAVYLEKQTANVRQDFVFIAKTLKAMIDNAYQSDLSQPEEARIFSQIPPAIQSLDEIILLGAAEPKEASSITSAAKD